jgi:hypothetical protein
MWKGGKYSHQFMKRFKDSSRRSIVRLILKDNSEKVLNQTRWPMLYGVVGNLLGLASILFSSLV